MSKKVSITEQIEELQAENERLSNLQKLFEKAVKEEFGYSVKELHKIIDEHAAEQPRKADKVKPAQQGQQSEIEHSEI
ncbi:MAG: hypothetical protein K6E63_07170 [Lachnospiraceae bacterium]|nr:hypothetical protein [Lachnospiraceae bacterium]